jgi:hypothetical protein
MKIDKFRRQATLRIDTGGTLDVNFFLAHATEGHEGNERILDVLNNESNFIPLEDILTTEILLIGKSKIMDVELSERDLSSTTLEASEMPVHIELVNGDIMEGSFFIEMPPDRSRLSDYLNFTPQFIYLCQEPNDLILNKAYVLSVKHM